MSNALSLGGAKKESLANTQSNAVGSSGGGTEGLTADSRGSSLTSLTDKPDHESVAALLAATSQFRNVDAIILVYDLDRIETFHRLENHWLPLIEQCYNGDLPVIVAGNKLDLTSASDDENSPSRQQIISLLQQFKFVRQCIKCSAKKLINVDEVFVKSQQSVLYPITPLYDLSTGKLSPACTRALTRTFRIFDEDNDGLLSDTELNSFQQKIWGVSLTEKDFNGWKKMAQQHDSDEGGETEAAIRDGKFTVSGFLAIFDVLISSQNRLEVPWKVLRALGYDDELNLNIPESVAPLDGNGLEYANLHPDDWRLTSSDIDFLMRVFKQFNSNGDGTLSSTDIHNIFSVLSIPLPPWDEGRTSLYQDCFTRPHVGDEETPPPSPGSTTHPSSPSSIVSASGVTISSSPLPSVDISKEEESICFEGIPTHKPLSFLSWINRWHMMYVL